MAMYLALLCSCIASVLALCCGRPHPVDSLKNLVKLQAENIMGRIQRHKDELQIFHMLVLDSPELLPELQPDQAIEGLGTITETLNTFQRVLHTMPKGHISQLQIDVSTLQDYLEDRMDSLQCPLRKTDTARKLESFLKNHGTYYITLGYVALDRLQRYLQRLVNNLDQLKTC